MSTTSTMAGRFNDPVARHYFFAGLAAQFVIAAALLARPGSNLVSAAVPPLLGALGLVGRLTVMPYIFLILLSYLLVVPTVTPLAGPTPPEITRFSHFRLTDIVLVAAVLVFFVAHFRLLGLTGRAMPADTPTQQRKKGERLLSRPSSIVSPGEFGRMFALLVACVVAGQIAWLLLAKVHIQLRGDPALEFGDSLRLRFPGELLATPEALSRFLLLVGLFGFPALAIGLGFWYWRLARLSPAQARMVLLDTEWRELRPDMARQEKWRARARNRSLTQATQPGGRAWSSAVIVGALAIGVIAFLILLGFCIWANRL